MPVAEARGQQVGCCRLQQRPEAEAYFGMFAVRPGSQGQGWGGRILAEAERLARDEWGASTMVMSDLDQRPDLIAWYHAVATAVPARQHHFPTATSGSACRSGRI